MSDDHDAHAISCYGGGLNQTPNLDRIAKEGMRFEHCFCTNSICAPSRAVILTGKYSHLNGHIDNSKTFDGTKQTGPKLLQQAGYETAVIGKWHLATDPTGFDYWHILPGQGAYYNPPMIEMGKRTKHQGLLTESCRSGPAVAQGAKGGQAVLPDVPPQGPASVVGAGSEIPDALQRQGDSGAADALRRLYGPGSGRP
jgi:arylsulfatase A-like enzyme